MFTIGIKDENGFQLWILEDGQGTQAVVLPACGAMLHQFSIVHQGVVQNVIENYSDAASFDTAAESLGFRGSKLSPYACRMNKGEYHFGEASYKVTGFYLGNHAIHGLLYKAAYIILQQEVSEEKAMIRLKHSYEGTDPGFPFMYDCIITYTLKSQHRLFIETTIINQSGKLMPIQDGWHPYFKLGDSINDCQLEFQSKQVVVFNDELLPTGELSPYETYGSLQLLGEEQFDHCFALDFAECQPLCVFRNPLKKLQVEIYPDKSYPYLQIYTPPHRQSIAIENLSAAPDAFNNAMGLTVLEPGEAASFTTQYKISPIE